MDDLNIKEISVSIMFTKNLGNYESLKLDAGVVVSVKEGESHEEVYEKAWNVARNQIKNGLSKGDFK